ncbi:MAG: hypothetical protein C5B46_05720 [Proteobacteria bacterium]|nr:MAG: hypothetical protein C5B46_05720 [Pseudomonadota bacterium]
MQEILGHDGILPASWTEESHAISPDEEQMELTASDEFATPSDERTQSLTSVDDPDDVRIAQIVASGPRGALAVAGLSVAFVVALWVAFYLFIFLPRGTIG